MNSRGIVTIVTKDFRTKTVNGLRILRNVTNFMIIRKYFHQNLCSLVKYNNPHNSLCARF